MNTNGHVSPLSTLLSAWMIPQPLLAFLQEQEALPLSEISHFPVLKKSTSH